MLSALCHEVGTWGETIDINHLAETPVYRDHLTPRRYGFQSYIYTPISRHSEFFKTLCASDSNPASPGASAVMASFKIFAQLNGRHLEADTPRSRSAALIELGHQFRMLDDAGEIAFSAAEVLDRSLGVTRSAIVEITVRASIYRSRA